MVDIKAFFQYLWLVIKRCFSRVFILVDLIGLALLVLSLKQPKIPLYVSGSLFGIIFVISTFTVWRDETRATEKASAEIKKLKDEIPQYTVDAEAIESFSAESLIKETEQKLEQLRPRSIKVSGSVPASSLASAIQTIAQMRVNLPGILGTETIDEKIQRLENHLQELKAYQKKIKDTYRVSLTFEATRADNNIEFEVEAPAGDQLLVKDNYASRELPRTYKPSAFGTANFLPSTLQTNHANRLYPYSHSTDNKGYSKLTKVNAKRRHNVFDEDLFVQSQGDKINLKITIHSEKLIEPTKVQTVIDLSNVAIKEVGHEEKD